MSEDDSLNASIAHIVLFFFAGQAMGRTNVKKFVHPGMHANFLVHGILGFVHHQNAVFNADIKSLYGISMAATRYLALPCLNADISDDKDIAALHLISGLIPFCLALSGKDNLHLGNLIILCNIISLGITSQQRNRTWGMYAAGAALVAYFATTQVAKKITYPIFLAIFEHCAFHITAVRLGDSV